MKTAFLLALLPFAAHAHDAPTGWSYGYECCSSIDCRPISSASVKEGAAGYTLPTGETLAYKDSRIRESKDEQFHWCSVNGRDDSRTLCLYVPLRGY